MPSFTVKTLKSWTTLGCFADDRAANLYLVCDEGTKGGFLKRWQFRYMRNGRAHRLGLGTAELVSLHVLRPLLAAGKRETAHKLQRLLFATARDARAHGLVSGENVASSDLVHPLLPKGKPRERKHFEAIALAALPAFMAELRARDGARYRCLEFAILTASRPDMVQAMAWGEVDLTARLWTVPASRMKSERSHVVPISERAVQILRPRRRAGS